MKNLLNTFLISLLSPIIFAQTYTSYYTGNPLNLITFPQGGICLMGGATEHDEASKWFLERANGGDILILRASGSDGYNDYFFSQLGVTVNSVETIVCNTASASNEAYIHQKINNAEAIWFAGGDQWDYISYWRDTPIDSLINKAISQRNIVIGGTSAGMAIQGKYYFSAENGTVTSTNAMSNPYAISVTVDSSAFMVNSFLEDVITDTHYDNPDRRGRHATFLARILTDYGIEAKGIACEEYTAVCIDENGIASVIGDYPSNDDYAYFIQTNCDFADPSPEVCTSGTPLTWNMFGSALKVYKVSGTFAGNNTFDLTNWETGSGGTWENWSVNNGVFSAQSGNAVDCGLSISEYNLSEIPTVYPNPTNGKIYIDHLSEIDELFIRDTRGQLIFHSNESTTSIDLSEYEKGIYLLEMHLNGRREIERIVLN